MYRMLIVDDESDERNVIRYLLNKFNFQFHIEEASNGREAYEQFKKTPVDILFTDVQMPFMNGIELAAKVQKLYPNVQIIFFSGHDDFEYIKQAFSLRAVDYILKPINPEEFRKTIASVIERAQMQKDANIAHLKNHVLYRLINQTPLETLEKECSMINLDFLNSYSRLILIQFEDSFFDQVLGENVSDCLGIACDYINLNPFQSVLLFQGKENTPSYYINLATKIQQHVLSLYNRNCYLSISDEMTNSSSISAVYKQAEGYLEHRFFFPETYIYPKDSSSIALLDDSGEDDYLLKTIQKAIQLKDSYSLKQDINRLFVKYKTRQCVSHIYIRFLFSNLLQILAKELMELKETEFKVKIAAIYSTQNLVEIEKIINELLNQGIKNLEVDHQSPKHAIHLVKQYIYEHYRDDLSLNILADKVFLTPRYLSSIFIQETGYGISKYIKHLRMNKAKELLLGTNMKINEICTAVGYSNLSYFCKSFQEDFGATPEKYRQIHP